jgi:GSH-dependent disulfide-bond oxidoreductase
MIDLYSWATPNGHKVHLMLEECGIPYAVHAIDIASGDQFKPEFLAISPNNRIPAIVDHNGPDGKAISLMESGAILLYLAGKTGRFMPRSVKARYECLQWLMWQMGGLGPMLGQTHHFRNYASEKIDYAINRYTTETKRLYAVLDKQLGKTGAFLTGDDYTIADIACWPWTRSHANHDIALEDFPHVKRWYETIESRPAAKRAVLILADRRKPGMDDKAKAILFGPQQYERR